MTTTEDTTVPSEERRPETSPGSVRTQIQHIAGRPLQALLAVTILISVVRRFMIASPLWLDEALSVNIARLPLKDLTSALRHDGHPPLYYVLLHGWMKIFGDQDGAVRALSGVISLSTIPLAWLVGRRVGGWRTAWILALVVAISPYSFRYGSETRMYSLVIALVFVLYLLLAQALEKSNKFSLAGLMVVTAALLWTHYWSLWLLIGTGCLLLGKFIGAHRRGDHAARNHAGEIILAMGLGALSFLPWLPTMLYQAQHTGTPWGPSFRPATLIMMSLNDFHGGPFSEAQLGMVFSVILIFLGIFSRQRAGSGEEVAIRFSPAVQARWPLALLLATTSIATAVGIVNKMAFHPRYAAVYFPFVVILIALGLNSLPRGRLQQAALALFAVFALVGSFFVERQTRTQSDEVAQNIRDSSPAGLVILCPDQLGPAVSRELDDPSYELLTYPRFEAPERVDWVDYKERNLASDPVQFATEALKRAGSRPIFVVNADNYLTLEGKCQRVIETLAATRAPQTLHEPDSKAYYEPMRTILFAAP